MLPVNRNPSASQVRTFGLTMLGGFGVIGALLWYLGTSPETGWGWAGSARQMMAVGCWLAGGVLVICSTTSTVLGRFVYIIWMTAASALGAMVTFVVLSLVYVLLLPPFALIRLTDPLRIGARRAETYWEDYPPDEPTVERMKRPF
jgi:hypothetical protein